VFATAVTDNIGGEYCTQMHVHWSKTP